MPESVITDELTTKLGVEAPRVTIEIEKGMLHRLAEAVGDPNSLWQDEDFAGKSRYGGIVAPPTFILTIGFEQMQQQRTVLALMPYEGGLHGSTELECYQPVRPGDAITVITKIANIREREGSRMGKMVFVTLDITYKNQRQELVARCQQVFISYKIEGAKYG